MRCSRLRTSSRTATSRKTPSRHPRWSRCRARWWRTRRLRGKDKVFVRDDNVSSSPKLHTHLYRTHLKRRVEKTHLMSHSLSPDTTLLLGQNVLHITFRWVEIGNQRVLDFLGGGGSLRSLLFSRLFAGLFRRLRLTHRHSFACDSPALSCASSWCCARLSWLRRLLLPPTTLRQGLARRAGSCFSKRFPRFRTLSFRHFCHRI